MKAVQCNPTEIIHKHGLGEYERVQQYVDNECLRLCEPMVPKDSNILIQSAKINTIIGSGELRYRTPYARRWYYMPANFQEAPERGNYWFERMKQKYKKQILAGAQKTAEGKA